jgi:hypothetical protein
MRCGCCVSFVITGANDGTKHRRFVVPPCVVEVTPIFNLTLGFNTNVIDRARQGPVTDFLYLHLA